ncbi:hypothetical protein ACFQ1I_19145 [Kitasatospora arboriphila]
MVPVLGPDGWQLTDGRSAVPLKRGATPERRCGGWPRSRLSHPVTLFGEYGHAGYAPVTAWSADGRAIGLDR